MKINRSRVIQTFNQTLHTRWCSRADFPELSKAVVGLVPNVAPHGIAVSAKPIGVRYTAIAGCPKPLALTPKKLPWGLANSHPAAHAVGLAVVVRGAGPVAQTFVARELKAHFSFPGHLGESCSVRLVHHCDDATSTSNRLVSSNVFHLLRVAEEGSKCRLG